MKKSLIMLFSILFLFTVLSVGTGAESHPNSNIVLVIDGKEVHPAPSAFIHQQKPMLPIRFISEYLGAEVKWEGQTKTATITHQENVTRILLSNQRVIVNDVDLTLDLIPGIWHQRTFVPSEVLEAALGVKVNYDEMNKKVLIESTDQPVVHIFSPKEGKVLQISGEEVVVGISVFNHHLNDFRTTMEPVEGEGHVHVWLDTDVTDPTVAYKMIKPGPVIFENVQEGRHTLTVQLVGNDHKPVQPIVKQSIQFDTKLIPSIAIQTPSDGQVIQGNRVTVDVDVSHFSLTDFRTATGPVVGEGHVHIWLDTDVNNPQLAYKLLNDEPVTFENVKPGTHTLTVQLVGNDHKPVPFTKKQVITFNTTGSKLDQQEKQNNPDEGTEPVTISIEDFKFGPSEIKIKKGTTVIFKNLDDVVHTATAKDSSFDTGDLKNGEQKSVLFNETGTFEYYCKPHPFMTGKIIVEE